MANIKNVTKKIPKPLLKVGKIPIIEHKINYYKSLNCNLTDNKIKPKKCHQILL